MTDGMLSLSWNNHSTTFCHTLAALRAKERYTDVTLACDGKFYPVHKLVLSTCSEYFENMFEHTPCKHPVIVLRDVHRDELEALLSYMYAGVVSVAQTDLARLIKVAELLEIKGLAVPDEPPNNSKTSSQRATDDRSSPHSRSTRQSHNSSSERRSPHLRMRQSQSSNDDRSSPHPKRRRRLESEPSSPLEDKQSVSASPCREASRYTDVEPPREEESTWMEDQEVKPRSDTEAEERIQEPLTADVQITLDESLVKEEVVDEPREDGGEASESGLEYNGLAGDSSGGGGQDASGLLLPKYDHLTPGQDMHSQSGLGAVIEALAGPSGMQGWAGGGDMAQRLALGENYGVEGSQDLSSLSLGQPTRQMVGRFKRERTGGADAPKKRHQCPYCVYSTARKDHLQKHIRTHTGEKPYACAHCPYRSSQKYNLKSHEYTHKL